MIIQRVHPDLVLPCGHSLRFAPSGPVKGVVHPRLKSVSLLEEYFRLFESVGSRSDGALIVEILSNEKEVVAILHQSFGCEAMPVKAMEPSDPIDLVVDVGGRGYSEARKSFEILWPRLKPQGYYIVEGWKPAQRKPHSFLDFLVDRVLDGSGEISRLIVSSDLVALEKGEHPPVEEPEP